MKITLYLLLFLLISIRTSGQEYPFWGKLEAGNYLVGYSDTIVYNKYQDYSFHTYKGQKPYFVGMWYPLNNDAISSTRVYADYFEFDVPENLKELRDTLVLMQQTSLITYGIKNRLASWDDRAYTQAEKELYDKILSTKVNATLSNKLPQKKYPVIVYHHGMGGTREENSVLFEYLASHGFVIISSNYHWPNQQDILAESINDLEFIVDYATTLPFIDKDRIHFLGHSWGGWMGLILNQTGNHAIKSFILLDNTLEEMSLEMVSRYYPDLDSIIRNHPNDFKTKTYVITSQKTYVENGTYVENPEPEFEAFKLINYKNFEFLITRNTLNHAAFISVGALRSTYVKEIIQDDAAAAVLQYKTYLELNEQLLRLLNDDKYDTSVFFKEIDLRKASNRR
jgi:pimeloyl-ACP methyl ester carboxylesterase